MKMSKIIKTIRQFVGNIIMMLVITLICIAEWISGEQYIN